MRNALNDFRTDVKYQICDALVKIYLANHNGLMPKWEDDDDEIIVTKDEVGTIKVDVTIFNTYDDFKNVETFTIDRYFLTLDGWLYFEVNDDTLDWTDISTDNLVDIWEKVNESYLKMKNN